MKQVHPDTGISVKAMTVVNDFVVDVHRRIMDEICTLAEIQKMYLI